MITKLNLFLKGLYQTSANLFVKGLGLVKWHTKSVITDEERNIIRQHLIPHYYIILTRHKGYLSTYAINFAHLYLSKFVHWGHYSHALMNLEANVENDSSFRLVESTAHGNGVHYTKFKTVFDQQCSSVALLKPKGMTIDEWTEVLGSLKSYIGTPYDTLYNLADETAMSCVELVRAALMTLPDYHTRFAHFEELIQKEGNLDPEMFYVCRDFEVVWETRH